MSGRTVRSQRTTLPQPHSTELYTLHTHRRGVRAEAQAIDKSRHCLDRAARSLSSTHLVFKVGFSSVRRPSTHLLALIVALLAQSAVAVILAIGTPPAARAEGGGAPDGSGATADCVGPATHGVEAGHEAERCPFGAASEGYEDAESEVPDAPDDAPDDSSDHVVTALLGLAHVSLPTSSGDPARRRQRAATAGLVSRLGDAPEAPPPRR